MEKTTDSGIKNEMAISEIAIANWDKISFKQKYTKIIINQGYYFVFAQKNAARCIGVQNKMIEGGFLPFFVLITLV